MTTVSMNVLEIVERSLTETPRAQQNLTSRLSVAHDRVRVLVRSLLESGVELSLEAWGKLAVEARESLVDYGVAYVWKIKDHLGDVREAYVLPTHDTVSRPADGDRPYDHYFVHQGRKSACIPADCVVKVSLGMSLDYRRKRRYR